MDNEVAHVFPADAGIAFAAEHVSYDMSSRRHLSLMGIAIRDVNTASKTVNL